MENPQEQSDLLRPRTGADSSASLEELRSQYNIGYVPTNPVKNGGFRRVLIKSKDGYKVQARSGYFAMPDKD